eukprot:TRINITY_DN10500_c0_g1_i2.p1 TRINITY_DN10500_c0_g1~~TRINITY_DN10500_c0_g1_i2.p1  ORF type:complete len:364 (-),score=39.50 TRINITY_DN10500_c0_g1_i2:245-1270(-)
MAVPVADEIVTLSSPTDTPIELSHNDTILQQFLLLIHQKRSRPHELCEAFRAMSQKFPDFALDYHSNDIERGASCLHVACRYGCMELVKFLCLECGVNIEVKNEYGETPLFYAVKYENPAVTEFLLEGGAIQTEVNSRGESPLWCAALEGSTECVSLLLDFQDGVAMLDVADNDGEPPVMAAIRRQHWKVVEVLLHHNCCLYRPGVLEDPRFSGQSNVIPHASLLHLLHNTLFGESNPNDVSALICALRNRSYHSLTILASFGVDLYEAIIDQEGRSALDYLEGYGASREMQEVLRFYEMGAEICEKRRDRIRQALLSQSELPQQVVEVVVKYAYGSPHKK